jgi:hypothetical protein
MEIPKDLKMIDASFPAAGEIAREPAPVVERVPDSFVKAVIAIATNAWRIRAKVADSTGESKEEISKDDVKKVNRYLETVFHTLSGIGMEIKDRTGEAFDYGLPEKVVTAQPQPGINKERILETLRPTIYWGNQIVQQGEVVIATPEESAKQEESK